MKNIMGMINLDAKEDLLEGITLYRPDAAVPFGGRYRLIDFILSSMVNSGVRNISIFTGNKHHSLVGHLRSGKDWDLDRKQDGLFVFHPENAQRGVGIYKGFLQNLYHNLDYIYRSKQKYVVISAGNVVCNLDLRPVLDFHLKTKADVTVIYKEEIFKKNFPHRGVMIDLRADGRVIDMIDVEIEFAKSKRNWLFNKKFNKISTGIYIMTKSLLIDLINSSVSRGYYDLVKDGFIKNMTNLRIYGYLYPGYLAKIDSIESYYKHNLELLQQEVWRDLFFNPELIYTKVKDCPPAKYMKNANVSNSLVANACLVDGIVESSILFRGVQVARGALVKNSIIMQETKIEQNVRLENVILDKEVHITRGKMLKGGENYPLVVSKKKVI